MSHHLISLMVFLPAFGALLQVFLPQLKGVGQNSLGKWIALIASLSSSVCGAVLVASMHAPSTELQAAETLPWVGFYAISYDMGVDGLNALLVLLVSILFPVLIAAEWRRKTGIRGMHGLFLLLQTALVGVICAQDLFLLFFFWGMTAFPFYFLLGIWGGEKRESAAFRSMVAASIGNALVFGALILVYYSIEPHTFLLRDLSGGKLAGKTLDILGHSISVSVLAFSLVGAGLALRAPIWPFHGWFTHAAEEAPSSVFVALAAATVPVSLYIFIRLGYSLFPETVLNFSAVIVLVGAINLIIGGICAMAQTDLKRLLAFICISEVGLALIGIGSLSAAGAVGAVYHQLVLGLAVSGFGLFSGVIVDRAGHTVYLPKQGERGFGGIATRAPTVAIIAGLVVASLLGFPGFGGFVAHALLIIGSYSLHPVAVAIAGAALVMATYYLFTMYRYVFLGKPSETAAAFEDLTLREKAYFFPVVTFLLIFGLYPRPFLELVRPTVLTLLSTIK